MTSRARIAVGLFVTLHVVALLADGLALHDPTDQHRELPFAPPTAWHWFDADGSFHWRPFVYRLEVDPQHPDTWREDRGQRFPLRLWVASTPWRLGPWTLHHRWLGVDPPAAFHPLGTDRFGRDIASRVLYGARRTLFTGLAAAWLAVLVGSVLGMVAGFYGGVTDRLIMSGAELALALPWLYLLLGVRAALPLDLDPSNALILLVLLVGLLAWAVPARLVRGEALTLRQRESMRAAEGFGASDVHLLRHHVMPAVQPTILTQWALLAPQCMLAEATLSFFGLGAVEPNPSLGTLLAADQALLALGAGPGFIAPALTLAVIVLSYHLLANAFSTSSFAHEPDAVRTTVISPVRRPDP